MSEIRERLHAHRNDALVLLRETSRTALLHSGFRLAGAVCHLARAQVLIAEELFTLPEQAEEGTADSQRQPAILEDDTPPEGISPARKPERPSR